MTTETKTQLDVLLGLTYSAQFVPFSRSRNAKKATKPGDYSLNWKVTFSKNGRSLTTDYMQGIGHIPGHKYNTRYTIDAWEALKRACEAGKIGGRLGSVIPVGEKAIPAPSANDVLAALCLDATVIEYASFEDWAEDFGYEKDSRSAEGIYRDCLRIALELRALIGEAGMETLRNATRDY